MLFSGARVSQLGFFFLFDAWAFPQDVLFDVTLHLWPEEMVPDKVCAPIQPLVAHLVMQLFQDNVPKLGG